VVRFFPTLVLAALVTVASGAQPRFNPVKDVLAFSNETYYEYQTEPDGRVTFHRRSVKEEDLYSRHCFVMARAVAQFHQFAAFRPDLPKATDAQYRDLIRRLSRIPVWSRGPAEKVIIPGYADLESFSADHVLLFQENLGQWWPSFWRLGNWRMVLPVPRTGQERTAEWLRSRLDSGHIQAVYLTRFRPLNHCLIVYHYAVRPNGDVDFSAYDCNQPKARPVLQYRAVTRSFYWPRNWYWSGGLVTTLKLYVSPLR
jgi:hypothetical protein